MASPAAVILDGAESARDAGLRYVTDSTPGLSRHRQGRGFIYRNYRQRLVGDARTLADPRAGDSACLARRVDLC